MGINTKQIEPLGWLFGLSANSCMELTELKVKKSQYDYGSSLGNH